jgi:hypothetical protein
MPQPDLHLRRHHIVLLRGALGLLLAACTNAGPGSTLANSAGSSLITTPPGQPYADAALGPATLEVGSAGGQQCYWVRLPDGRHGSVWPYGFTATGPPGSTTINDATGTPVVHEGTQFWITGGLSDVTAPLGPCATGETVYVGVVSASNPISGSPGDSG